jgi:adenylate cyclase
MQISKIFDRAGLATFWANKAKSVLLSAICMRSLALITACLIVLILQVFKPHYLESWSARVSDHMWFFGDRAAHERRIVIVDIDEKSTQALGSWPWPRERVAALLSALDQQGVSLKIVDILFEESKAGDVQLRASIHQGAPTTVAQLFSLQPEQPTRSGMLSGQLTATNSKQICAQNVTQAYGFMAPTAELGSEKHPLITGHITPSIDGDGVVRKVPAIICHDGRAYPALAVSALAVALSSQPRWVSYPGFFGARHAVEVGDLRLPTNEQAQLLVSYQVPRAGFIAVSASDVLAGRVPPDLLKGAWALLGSTAFGASDAIVTPQGAAVGGIEVHAQLLSAALDGRTPAVPIWAALWPWMCALGSTLILLGMLKWSRMTAALAIPLAAVFNAATIFAVQAYLLLTHHQMLAYALPFLFVVLSACLVFCVELLRVRFERERLFQNLCSYLPEGAARKIAFVEPNAQVQAQEQKATVMFVDLRNFSAYCEGRTPEQSAVVLHLFYTTLERVVSQHGGAIEEMVGDSIMAVWNGSTPCPNHASRAVAAARDVWREGLAQLPRLASRKTPALDLGIGIETGVIVIGSFGPAQRRVHSVLGPAVTVASRLQALTAELAYPILIGPQAVAESAATQLKPLGDFLLLGTRQTCKIHALPVQYPAHHLQLAFSAESDTALQA